MKEISDIDYDLFQKLKTEKSHRLEQERKEWYRDIDHTKKKIAWLESLETHPGYKCKDFEDNIHKIYCPGVRRISYLGSIFPEKELSSNIHKIIEIQFWKISTEGDCEGKTVKNYGVYQGTPLNILTHLLNTKTPYIYGFKFDPLWFGESYEANSITKINYNQHFDSSKFTKTNLEVSLPFIDNIFTKEFNEKLFPGLAQFYNDCQHNRYMYKFKSI